MKWTEVSKEQCSVSRASAVLGDRWTLLLLSDIFLGVRRFEDFQERLDPGVDAGVGRMRIDLEDEVTAGTGVFTITPAVPLPAIVDTDTTLDGSTQTAAIGESLVFEFQAQHLVQRSIVIDDQQPVHAPSLCFPRRAGC